MLAHGTIGDLLLTKGVDQMGLGDHRHLAFFTHDCDAQGGCYGRKDGARGTTAGGLFKGGGRRVQLDSTTLKLKIVSSSRSK
jgi:hypothetical protein